MSLMVGDDSVIPGERRLMAEFGTAGSRAGRAPGTAYGQIWP